MAAKILIVDDDLDTLRLVGLLLQRKGYQIVAADNGLQAIEKANQENPDLILLDIMMPEMDGVEVLRRLRSNSVTAETPVIMFTAKSQIEDKVTGFESGADDYLTKPTHPAELTARVQTILARTAAKRTPAAADQPPKIKGKIIGVLGAKGGLGVSTVTLNLGMTLDQEEGINAVVAELRPGFGSMSLMLGIAADEHLVPLLRKEAAAIGEADLQHAVASHESGIRVLLASYQPTDGRYQNAGEQMSAIVEQLSYMFTHVVVDLGSGLSSGSSKVVEKCDTIVIVIEPSNSTVAQTRALLDELRMKVLGLGAILIAQVSRARINSHLPLREIQNQLGHSIAAAIPAEPDLAYQAAEQSVPLTLLKPNGEVARQFKKLAAAVISG